MDIVLQQGISWIPPGRCPKPVQRSAGGRQAYHRQRKEQIHPKKPTRHHPRVKQQNPNDRPPAAHPAQDSTHSPSPRQNSQRHWQIHSRQNPRRAADSGEAPGPTDSHHGDNRRNDSRPREPATRLKPPTIRPFPNVDAPVQPAGWQIQLIGEACRGSLSCSCDSRSQRRVRPHCTPVRRRPALSVHRQLGSHRRVHRHRGRIR